MNENTASGVEEAIGEWIFRYYGLEGSLERLAGENLNYLLTTPEGQRFVFKAVDQASSQESAAMEFELLEHARKAGFPLELPYIVKNYNQEIDSGIELPLNGSYRSRIISFVDGIVFENISNISTKLLKSAGKSLALFDLAIADFKHPEAHRGHQWELPLAGQHRDKLKHFRDPEQQSLVAWAFDVWAGVQDTLATLPHQFIHGDANKENILVEGEQVSGLVDFGDACYNPRVCELAICLAYLMMDREDPMAAAESVMAGYSEEIELGESELAVLFPLVCGRLAVTICMATARQSIDPGNPNWFVSLKPAAALLEKLRSVGLG